MLFHLWCVAIHVFPLYTLSVPKIWLPFPSILEKRENIDGLNIRVTDAATQLGQRFRRQKSPAWKNRPGNDAVKETMIATVKQTILVGWLLFILDDSHACLVCLCYLRRNRKLVKLLLEDGFLYWSLTVYCLLSGDKCSYSIHQQGRRPTLSIYKPFLKTSGSVLICDATFFFVQSVLWWK